MELAREIENAIREGLKARGNGSVCGAGRAYVCLSKVDRKTLNAYKKGIAAAGLRYLPKSYGAGDRAIYVGYDNFSGRQIAQAKEIEKNLRALGLPAYWDAVAD